MCRGGWRRPRSQRVQHHISSAIRCGITRKPSKVWATSHQVPTRGRRVPPGDQIPPKQQQVTEARQSTDVPTNTDTGTGIATVRSPTESGRERRGDAGRSQNRSASQGTRSTDRAFDFKTVRRPDRLTVPSSAARLMASVVSPDPRRHPRLRHRSPSNRSAERCP